MEPNIRPKRFGIGAGRGGVTVVGLLGIALLAGLARAQPLPPEYKPDGQSQETPKPQVQPSATTKPVSEEPGQGSAIARRKQREFKFDPDPDAKWACDELTATVEPFWPSDDKPTFTFHIRNEGKADLKIKAKGG